MTTTVDVGTALDEGRWTGYQKLLIVGTALTIILDGVDNQLLPNAVCPANMARSTLVRTDVSAKRSMTTPGQDRFGRGLSDASG